MKICCQASAIMNLYVFWLSRGENSWFIYNKDICLSREGANSLVWMRYYGQLICCANLSQFMSFFREAATFWVKEGLGSYFSGKNCLTVLIISRRETQQCFIDEYIVFCCQGEDNSLQALTIYFVCPNYCDKIRVFIIFHCTRKWVYNMYKCSPSWVGGVIL